MKQRTYETMKKFSRENKWRMKVFGERVNYSTNISMGKTAPLPDNGFD